MIVSIRVPLLRKKGFALNNPYATRSAWALIKNGLLEKVFHDEFSALAARENSEDNNAFLVHYPQGLSFSPDLDYQEDYEETAIKYIANDAVTTFRVLKEDLISARKHQGLSIQTVAERMGVSENTVIEMEAYEENITIPLLRRYIIAVNMKLTIHPTVFLDND